MALLSELQSTNNPSVAVTRWKLLKRNVKFGLTSTCNIPENIRKGLSGCIKRCLAVRLRRGRRIVGHPAAGLDRSYHK